MVQTLLVQKIIQLVLIILMGFALVRCRIVKAGESVLLSKISLYILAPCAIINSFQIEYDAEVLRGLLTAVIAAVLIHAGLILLAETAGKAAGLNTVEQTSVIYSNSGNLVIPIVTYVLGEEWVVYSTAFMAVQLVFMWTHCVSKYQGQKGFQIKKIFTNINLIAIALGIVLMLGRVQLPGTLSETLDTMGSMLGPAAMLVVGMLAGGMHLKEVFLRKRIYLIAALRLVAVPLAVLAVMKAMMAAGLVARGSYLFLVIFIAAITPTASMITQFAQVYGSDAEYAGAISLVSTLLCMITMPVMVWLYML